MSPRHVFRPSSTSSRPPASPAPPARSGGSPPQEAPELTDEELDAWILARLKLAGVDLSVLPEDDPDAPADRRRIMESARRFLRSTPAAILGVTMDVQEVPPVLYPAELAAWTGRVERDGMERDGDDG